MLNFLDGYSVGIKYLPIILMFTIGKKSVSDVGGAAPLSPSYRTIDRCRLRVLFLHVAFFNNSKYLRKNDLCKNYTTS